MARKLKESPIGRHYHICAECGKLVDAETTDSPYPSAHAVEVYGDDPTIPVDCGCDDGYNEDKVCEECGDALERQAQYDAYDSDRDYDDYDFADPGSRSALRAEVGGSHGKCPQCKGVVGKTANYCKSCGHKLNPRSHDCPTCGAKGVLTTRDVELHYQCNNCADRAEGIYVGADY